MNTKALYALRNELNSMTESSKDDDKEKSKAEELEERIENIKKKKTRGFISEDEAEEDLSKVQKKVNELKEKLNDKSGK